MKFGGGVEIGGNGCTNAVVVKSGGDEVACCLGIYILSKVVFGVVLCLAF